MAFEIQNLNTSPSRKRFDMTVLVQPFWSSDWSFNLRILARQEIDDDQLRNCVQQVVDRKSEWKGCKVNQTIQLNGVNANAFIINEPAKKDKDEQPGSEGNV